MSDAPFVIVTATTESLRGRSRVRVNEAYTRALAAVHLVPMVLPPVDASVAVASLGGVHGLVITGGEDVDPAHFGQSAHPATGTPHPERDAYELALASAARDRRVPTLAICRGAQVMNVALGGTLVQDIPSQRPSGIEHDLSDRRTERVHAVEIGADSALARVVGSTRITTNSSHHQSIDRPADELRVTASSEDGIVEALEPLDPSWWMIAVQWHPEELTATPEDWDRRLFAAFAHAVCTSKVS
ncbi:MAG TPA: gamma-glutamyl-gamma-aminobutyrate hydrolase family protein [Gemmatimonadaceae bacterium]